MKQGKMKETAQFGAEFWNDSSDLEHLQEAIDAGAVGATSNPVIVYQAITRQKDLWAGVAKNLIREYPKATESEIAWILFKDAGKKASELLLPIYAKSEGRKGKISLQVNPYLYPSSEQMVKQGVELSQLGPNITIKVPATEAGIQAMEDLCAQGISINATVSFSVAQALASAEAIERGVQKARQSGKLSSSHTSYVTLMVGRIEDYLRTVIIKERISIDPVSILWSGIAVFKKAHQLFLKHNFHATLLSAAYRHQMHWTELIGDKVVLTIPYEWWKTFERSEVKLTQTLQYPVPEGILTELYKVPSFEILMNEKALKKEDFVHLTPARNTLLQFVNGQDDLVKWIRSMML
jgi:transaldolase